MFITRMALPRRTLLRGLGATIALPLLDAMRPAMTVLAKTPASPVKRLGFIYTPNGATMSAWTPASEGPLLADLSPTLALLELLAVPEERIAQGPRDLTLRAAQPLHAGD